MTTLVYIYLIVGCVVTLLILGIGKEQFDQKSDKEKKEAHESRSKLDVALIVVQYITLPVTWLPALIYYTGRMIGEGKEEVTDK